MSKNNLKGFKVIKAKFSASSTTDHELFMKEHTVRHQSPDTPENRTLFLINVPPWATTQSLTYAFSKTAPVTCTKFTNDDSGFKSAYVIFQTEVGLVRALQLTHLPPLSSKGCEILVGVEKWKHDYNNDVLKQADSFAEAMRVIKSYDEDEARKKKRETETDGDGWKVVTKKGRNPGLARKESVRNKLGEKMAKKEKVLKNFYRHQIRQEKRDQLAVLRKKAEEDKKKIVALKQRRAFKPY